MNFLANIKNSILGLSLLLSIGCVSAETPNLTGKWMNSNKNWGLEFQDNKIYEWERGEKRKEATYQIVESDGVQTLVIEDGGRDLHFPFEIINDAKIKVNMKEWIELEKKE